MTEATTDQSLAAAIQHHQSGRINEAEAIYRSIVAKDPNNVDAVHLLGVIAHQNGRQKEAYDLIFRASCLQPTLAPIHSNLGLVYSAMGKPKQAAGSHRKAVQIDPSFVAGHYNLGNALVEMGRARDSIPAFRRALELNPRLPDVHYILGNVYLIEGMIVEAIVSYRNALANKPDFPEAYNNLGTALRINNRADASVNAFESALKLRPNFVDACNNLGNLMKEMGRSAEALVYLDQSLAANSNAPQTLSNRLHLLHYLPQFDGPTILTEQKKWDTQFAQPLKSLIEPHGNMADPNRRLKIGYVSPNFRDHVVGRNLLPLIQNHDAEKFDVFCYSVVGRSDAITQQFKAAAGTWKSVVGMQNEKAAALIREDEIDILVDLSLHMPSNCLPLFARKPAPIQATFGGYPAGAGLDAIDYRISDQYLDPPEHDSHYREKTMRLADSFWCYDSIAMGLDMAPPVGPLPALQNGYITFGCLNNFCKVNEGVLDLWSQVLHAAPQSRLMIMVPPGSTRDRVIDTFASKGIEALRLHFAVRSDRASYFELFNHFDIGLDTQPYNGHTSSLDSFWMGVPVLTLVGKTSVGRAGWSQLCNLKLRKFAVQSTAKYIELAMDLTRDVKKLAELRGTLRKRMADSPLMNGKKFAQGIEEAYRKMWTDWCAAGK